MIVDHHRMVSAGLRLLVESQTGMKVVAMATNEAEALALADVQSPDLILLDLELGTENGLTLLPKLRHVARDARVLVLTGLRDLEAHREAMRLGAMGIVLKDQGAEVLIKAMEKVRAGEVWIDRAMMGLFSEVRRRDLNHHAANDRNVYLTQREREVISLIAEGLKNKQIGERLSISDTTVTHHLSSIFSKLGVSDRLELVIYAFAHNLTKAPPQSALPTSRKSTVQKGQLASAKSPTSSTP
jgi:two-component system nitrate/nitrite response regulator NarL